MTLLALAPLAATAAEEGKKVITAMLIVGLIFIGVIALGETSRWLRRRRGRAHWSLAGNRSSPGCDARSWEDAGSVYP
jgi:hypothetical protein